MARVQVTAPSLQLAHQQHQSVRQAMAFAEVLGLGGAELDELVTTELSVNPALVRVETSSCPGCGRRTGGPCRHCRTATWYDEPPDRSPALRDRILADLRADCDASDRAIADHVVAA